MSAGPVKVRGYDEQDFVRKRGMGKGVSNSFLWLISILGVKYSQSPEVVVEYSQTTKDIVRPTSCASIIGAQYFEQVRDVVMLDERRWEGGRGLCYCMILPRVARM